MKPFTIVLVGLLFMSACSSTKHTNDSNTSRDFDTVEASNYEVTLLDFIQKLPGVTVRGSGENLSVKIHAGGNSFYNDSEPLFLIDGSEFSGDFQVLMKSLNPSDIESVSVYKDPAEVGIYGVRGLNGVINIKLK